MPKKKAQQPRRGFSENKSRYRAPRVGGKWHDEIARGERSLPAPEALPDGTVRYFLIMGQKGRVLFPADLRESLGLDEGDVITAWLRDGEVRMHSYLHGLRKVQEEVSSLTKAHVYASEELIADRRAESARDEEETALALKQARKRKG